MTHSAPADQGELASRLARLEDENRELTTRLQAVEARLDRLDRAHWLPPIAPGTPSLLVDPPTAGDLRIDLPLSERPTERLPKPTL